MTTSVVISSEQTSLLPSHSAANSVEGSATDWLEISTSWSCIGVTFPYFQRSREFSCLIEHRRLNHWYLTATMNHSSMIETRCSKKSCIVCMDTFPSSSDGFCCPSGHFICQDDCVSVSLYFFLVAFSYPSYDITAAKAINIKSMHHRICLSSIIWILSP